VIPNGRALSPYRGMSDFPLHSLHVNQHRPPSHKRLIFFFEILYGGKQNFTALWQPEFLEQTFQFVKILSFGHTAHFMPISKPIKCSFQWPVWQYSQHSNVFQALQIWALILYFSKYVLFLFIYISCIQRLFKTSSNIKLGQQLDWIWWSILLWSHLYWWSHLKQLVSFKFFTFINLG
jgi:hypothetical protein